MKYQVALKKMVKSWLYGWIVSAAFVLLLSIISISAASESSASPAFVFFFVFYILFNFFIFGSFFFGGMIWGTKAVWRWRQRSWDSSIHIVILTSMQMMIELAVKFMLWFICAGVCGCIFLPALIYTTVRAKQEYKNLRKKHNLSFKHWIWYAPDEVIVIPTEAPKEESVEKMRAHAAMGEIYSDEMYGESDE